MQKESLNKGKGLYFLIFKTAVIEIAVTAISMLIFAAVMFLAGLDKNLSPVLATVSAAIGTLIAAFFAAKKIGNRGYLIGIAVGGATFIIITLISLIVDGGSITFNTLFHFIIIMLSALIGGISGVNKKGKKYI